MLDLDGSGTVVFFGTMNAMPMMYALELKRRGHDVVYFVDVKRSDTLSRPENHYTSISYPYPDWVIEAVLPNPLLATFFPRTTLQWMLRRAGRRCTKAGIKAVFAGGNFVTFLPLFGTGVAKIFLSFGSDLDVWCRAENCESLTHNARRRWALLKRLPRSVAQLLIRGSLSRNFGAASAADAVLYFPPGMSEPGDQVIERLSRHGVKHVPRYDISFDPVRSACREFKPKGARTVIFSGVRFLFRSLTAANVGENKGNDTIIEGLALYRRRNPAIEVHFVEKGPDVAAAKSLCERLGIADVVVWHREMPFVELLKLYEAADVCFDQVGNHWVGAIGAYALYLGKPLIANAENLGFLGPNPILSARTAEEICEHLVRLEDEAVRREIWAQSKAFAERTMGPGRALDALTVGVPGRRVAAIQLGGRSVDQANNVRK